MKTFLDAVNEAARETGDAGFYNWLQFKLDAEQLEYLQRAADIYAELSNSHKPVVMQGPELNLPSMGEVSDAIEMLAKKSTAPDAETPDWLKADIRNGINWALNYVTKHNTSPAVGNSAAGKGVRGGIISCPSCGQGWDLTKNNACSCGAQLRGELLRGSL